MVKPFHRPTNATPVAVRRTSSAAVRAGAFDTSHEELERFSIPSQEGNERLVMERVGSLASQLGLIGERLEGLKTAVSEASMNAIEHGNGFDPALPVDVTILRGHDRLVVRIGDRGNGPSIPDAGAPDLDAKLAGGESPRGWGLFLIEQMVDRFCHHAANGRHVTELEMSVEGVN
ncbi:MAG: ATP-binding protein [Acidimicrobiia bacterium]